MIGFIQDRNLYSRWAALQKHLTTRPVSVYQSNNLLRIQTKSDAFYLAKNKQKMRLLSHIDWCYYDPQTLAQSMDQDEVHIYYEVMLHHPNSDPNKWGDTDYEQYLKAYYAARVGRAEML